MILSSVLSPWRPPPVIQLPGAVVVAHVAGRAVCVGGCSSPTSAAGGHVAGRLFQPPAAAEPGGLGASKHPVKYL